MQLTEMRVRLREHVPKAKGPGAGATARTAPKRYMGVEMKLPGAYDHTYQSLPWVTHVKVWL